MRFSHPRSRGGGAKKTQWQALICDNVMYCTLCVTEKITWAHAAQNESQNESISISIKIHVPKSRNGEAHVEMLRPQQVHVAIFPKAFQSRTEYMQLS